jgi:hypothetical protein
MKYPGEFSLLYQDFVEVGEDLINEPLVAFAGFGGRAGRRRCGLIEDFCPA